MHVVIVSQYFYPEVGATQNRMASFAAALARAGDSVTVVTEFPNHPHGVISEEYRGRWMERTAKDGYSIVRMFVLPSRRKSFAGRIVFYLSFMFSSFVGGMLSKPQPDVVLVTSPPIFAAFSGWLLARLRGAKLVFDVRDLWPAAAVELGRLRRGVIERLSISLERFLYRNANLITVTTESFRRIISEYTSAAPILLTPNGTEPALFSPQRSDDTLRGKLGFENKFVAGFAGNLGIAQELDTILESAHLLRDDPTYLFFLIGGGPEKRRLQRKAEALGLGNVVFHDQVPVEEIPPYLLACDVLLVTLNNKPLFSAFVPSKLFDYLACEKPVISNVRGEAESILKASGGGIVIPGDDAKSMRDALVMLSADAEIREKMGANGREYVAAYYNRTQIANGLVRQLHTLFGKPQGEAEQAEREGPSGNV